MSKKCIYCEIPDRKLSTKDYFDKINLWREYVDNGFLEFLGGDSSLENLEATISKEEKYAYYHYFKCICGNYIKTGVCIRSSVPLLEHVNSIPGKLTNGK